LVLFRTSLQFSAIFYLNCMAEWSVSSNYFIYLICCVFRALIRCIEFIKNALQFYEFNVIVLGTATCLGHSCGHLHGGKCKDTNIFIVCRDHSTVNI